MRTLIALVLLSLTLSVVAKPKQSRTESTPAAYAIWDVDSGRILADKNVDAIRSMASITKLMTVLITIERELNLDERLTVTGSETSKHIRRGMTVTRRELINLALVASDNLAANTLSETSGVDKHEFIGLMNYRAQSLNMINTQYFDPVGMSPFNVSTVYDIKTLTQYLERYAVFSENAIATSIVVTPNNKNKNTKVTARNTNVFAGKLNILAAKTGFTSAAGRCLTMLFIDSDNHKYVLVVLGATTNDQRQKMVKQLIDSIR